MVSDASRNIIEKGKVVKGKLLKKYIGGEAEVRIYENVVEKIRKSKKYRIKELDEVLRKKRTKTEVKLMNLARKNGVATPIVLDVDLNSYTIIMERVVGTPIRDIMSCEISREIGMCVAKLHRANIVHGDVTPMNMIKGNQKVYFVDFGLAFIDTDVEPKGVDVHVYFEALKAYFDDWMSLKKAFIEGYTSVGDEEVIKRAEEIAERGRYVERVSQQ